MSCTSKYFQTWSRIFAKLGVKTKAVTISDLGLAAETCLLETDTKLPLIASLGGTKGMILFPEGTRVLSFHERLQSDGYGYSVVDCPSDYSLLTLNNVREMLSDWGWVEITDS